MSDENLDRARKLFVEEGDNARARRLLSEIAGTPADEETGAGARDLLGRIRIDPVTFAAVAFALAGLIIELVIYSAR